MGPEPANLLLVQCESLGAKFEPCELMHPLAWERLVVFVEKLLFWLSRYLPPLRELLLSFCPQPEPVASKARNDWACLRVCGCMC